MVAGTPERLGGLDPLAPSYERYIARCFYSPRCDISDIGASLFLHELRTSQPFLGNASFYGSGRTPLLSTGAMYVHTVPMYQGTEG